MKATIRFRERKTTAKGRPGKVWLVDWMDQQGKRHQDVVRDAAGRSTRELAEQRLEQIIGEKAEGLVVARKRRTFAELRAQYLTDVASSISVHTLVEYRRIVEKRLAPSLDGIRVDQIGVQTVRALKAKLIADGSAAATVNKALILLSMILSTAVADRELTFNPCDHVRKVPAKRRTVDADTGDVGEKRALTREELAALLTASEGLAKAATDYASKLKVEAARVRYQHSAHCYHAVLVTAARSGLRASELFGLRWEDVDFAGGTVSVKRRFRNGTFDVAKSRTSTRTVPVTADAVAVLRAWRIRSPHKAAGALVFCTVRGAPLSPSNVSRRGVQPAAKAAGLTGVGLHLLRHTWGSHLLAAGEDLASVSKYLGHASIAITAAVYMHAVAKAPEVTARKLEQYLAGA